MSALSRRACLQGLIAGATLGLGRKLAFAEPAAQAKSAVVSIFFEGGFNALFTSADSFKPKGTFGVTSSNMKEVGNGLFVDAPSIGSLGDWALGHMAAIGARPGSSDHNAAQKIAFSDGTRSYALQLAAAMGGTASFKAAALGQLPTGAMPAESGTSMQLLRTVGDALGALGLGEIDFNMPARNISADAIENAKKMSGVKSFDDGYATQVDALRKPPLKVDAAKVTQAYRSSTGAKLDTMAAKLAAAELMIRGGTNVLTVRDLGWDTHGDRSGTTVRNRMTSEIIPSLKIFLARMRSEPELAAMNVTVMLHGDFARSLPSSDHATALSALVIGPNVKVGTTGKVSADVTLPGSVGGTKELWSYLAAVSKANTNPFGVNPHNLVL